MTFPSWSKLAAIATLVCVGAGACSAAATVVGVRIVGPGMDGRLQRGVDSVQTARLDHLERTSQLQTYVLCSLVRTVRPNAPDICATVVTP